MGEAEAGSLTQRVHRQYPVLPARERAVADLVLDSPGEVAFWNASELAARAETSVATVSRLFQRLGYDGYESARRAARAARASGSPLYLAQHSPERAAEADVAAVEMTLSAANPLALAEVAGRLARAPKVRLVGFRNSMFLADYLVTVLSNYRPGVAPLLSPSQTLAEGLADIGRGDIAVAVGFRRRPAGFRTLVEAVAASGAEVALIADRSIRQTPASARWTLLCAVETTDGLDSYAGAFALARRIAGETTRQLGAAGRRRLESIEALHETVGDLE